MINKIKNLFQDKGFKKYFANTSWLFLERIFRMAVGLFVGIWIARYLGPDRFGFLSYAQSFVGLFSAIATLGLNGILVRELVQYPEKKNELMGTAFILKLFGAFLTLLILYIAIHFTSNDTYTNILIFIIASATIFQAFNVIDFYFQAKVMSKYVVFANSFSLLLSSFIKIILILNQAPLIAFAVMIVFDSLVMAMGYVYWYFKVKKEFFLRKIKFQFDIAKKLLKDSWPLILSGMTFVIYNNIDKVMLQNMLNEKAVGIYSAASRLVLLWQFIPGLIMSSFMPSLTNSFYNKRIFFKKLSLLSSFLIWSALIISFIYIFFNNFIIKFTFGKAYQEASLIMSILVISNVFVFFNTVWNRWQLLEHKTQITFYFSLTTSILNIIFNFIFIKLYGIKGSAYALIFSLSISYVIFYVILDKRVIKLFFYSLILKKDIYDKIIEK